MYRRSGCETAGESERRDVGGQSFVFRARTGPSSEEAALAHVTAHGAARELSICEVGLILGIHRRHLDVTLRAFNA